MDFFDRYPIGSATGFIGSVALTDLKPMIFVLLAFLLDVILKWLKKKMYKND